MRGKVDFVAAVARRMGTGLLFLAAGSPASPSLAADDGPVRADLIKACNESAVLCGATCNEQYRGRKGFSAELARGLCIDECNRNNRACFASIPAAAQAGGFGGGAVLEPGPRQPPQKKRPPVGAPASGGVAQ